MSKKDQTAWAQAAFEKKNPRRIAITMTDLKELQTDHQRIIKELNATLDKIVKRHEDVNVAVQAMIHALTGMMIFYSMGVGSVVTYTSAQLVQALRTQGHDRAVETIKNSINSSAIILDKVASAIKDQEADIARKRKSPESNSASCYCGFFTVAAAAAIGAALYLSSQNEKNNISGPAPAAFL